MSAVQENAGRSPDPPAAPQGPFRLLPVLPSTNYRYNHGISIAAGEVASQKVRMISPWSRVIPLPYTTPEGWECHVHPDGDKYYRHPELRAVTPVTPLDQVTARVLEQAATGLIEALGARGNNTIEIYLNIPEDEKVAVQYCYIDHTNRQVFWARGTSTAELGLEPFESISVLRSFLTGEYWDQVENFPCHLKIQWAKAEEELKVILRHGIIDNLSSPSSSCPWTAEECSEYIKIIERFEIFDHGALVPSRVTSVARLWATYCRARHINQYGLMSLRLDRGLFEYYQCQKKASLNIALGESFCLWVVICTFARLVALWIIRVANERPRYRFFKGLSLNWITMAISSLAVLTIDITLLAAGYRSETTMASASMAGASFLISLIFHQAHSQGRLAKAPNISAYTPQVKDYIRGLHSLSIIFTLPHILTMYSAFLLQSLLLMMCITNLTFLCNILSVALICFLSAFFSLLLFALFGGRSLPFS